MFGIFASEQTRTRRDAQNWLSLATKVLHFRRDQLPAAEVQSLQQTINELRARLRERADAARLKMAIEHLEACLRRSGGSYYPKSSLVDNAEFFLVAAILFLGIRAFFVQPFKIPTNSMWPSYYGMTAEVFSKSHEEPGAAGRVFRLLAFGASARRIDAPVEGEVSIAVFPTGSATFYPAYRSVSVRRWLVLPGEGFEYMLFVGKTAVPVTVPPEFKFDRVLLDAFFGGSPTEMAARMQQAYAQRTDDAWMDVTVEGRRQTIRMLRVPTGRQVRAGERVLSFDIMTGDQLFVDRVSYHFMRPHVGDGFVFRTRNIRGIEREGQFSDKYYIKRLVGVPGDTLAVQEPVLFRNGKPIAGADAFELNAGQQGQFRGYSAVRALAPGKTVKVPPGSFFAMGDNSYESSDSRYWGFVPAGDVVGRPLFIYYPFTRRWGFAP